MNYISSIIVTVVTAVALFLFGPIILVPISWWIVNGRSIAENGREFRYLTLNRALLISIFFGWAGAYVSSSFLDELSFVDINIWIASIALVPLGTAKLLLSEEVGKAFQYQVSFAYAAYLISLIVFSFIYFACFLKLTSFRRHLFLVTNKKTDPKKDPSLINVQLQLVLILLGGFGLSLYFYAYFMPLSERSIFRENSLVLLSSCLLLVTFTFNLIFFALLKRVKRGISIWAYE